MDTRFKIIKAGGKSTHFQAIEISESRVAALPRATPLLIMSVKNHLNIIISSIPGHKYIIHSLTDRRTDPLIRKRTILVSSLPAILKR
jgi:hypothetical protein